MISETGNTRISNGYYTAGGAREIVNSFYRAAMQVEKLKGKVDILQAETDTCPQNRYSTGAMINIGFDPFEEVELMRKEPVSEVQMLMPDGSRKALEFQYENGKCTIGVSCVTLQPLVLFIR